MTQRLSGLRAFALLTAIPLLLAVSAAPAEEVQERQPASFEASLRLDDGLLQRYAEARARVLGVEERVAQALESAANDDERMQILIQASVDTAQAMRSTGLALEAYNHVAVHVSANPALIADIEQRVAALAN